MSVLERPRSELQVRLGTRCRYGEVGGSLQAQTSPMSGRDVSEGLTLLLSFSLLDRERERGGGGRERERERERER